MSAAAARPATLAVDPAGIPNEMKRRPQWVLTRLALRDGKWTKEPCQLGGKPAATDDPSTWSTFADVLAAYQGGGWDGIGYVFAADDPYFGVDIDKVKTTPDREAWALSIARRFGSYTEWSLSGAGLHIIGRGRMPDVGAAEQKGRHDREKGLEAYSRLRFFTFTGCVVEGTTTRVVPCQEALDWLLANEFTAPASERATVRLVGGTAQPLADDDQARIDKMLNGKRGAELRELWNGGSKHHDPDGTPDHSGDDLSLMNALAFWLDKDPGRMASAFLSSGRNRPKLHERHAADGSTYLEMTIGEAIVGCRQSYGDLVGRRAEATAVPPATTVDDPGATEDVAALRAEIARLHRLTLDQSDKVDELAGIVQVQQARLADVVPKLEAKTQFLSHVTDILAKPNEELSAGEKVVSIALAYEIHFRADYGPYTLPDGTEGSYRLPNGNVRMTRNVIARRTGYSPGTAAGLARQIAERESAPYGWHTTREWKTYPDGVEGWVTTIEIEPRTERTADALRAIATLPALPDKSRHGGSKAAAEARWKRCDEHQDAAVIVRGYCATCGKVLGERTLRADECEGLEMQDASPDDPPPSVDAYVPKEMHLAFPDDPSAPWCQRAIPEPVSNGNGHIHSNGNGAAGTVTPPRPKRQVWRCPNCGAMERHERSPGEQVCSGCKWPVATVRELAPGVVETTRAGPNGAAEVVISRDPSLPPVDKSITARRACCGSGIVHQRAGRWTCADCGRELMG